MNKWEEMPPMNNCRYFGTTALLKDRYLYAIGRKDTSGSIEMFDLQEKGYWRMITYKAKGYAFEDEPAALSISDNEILIFSGSFTIQGG